VSIIKLDPRIYEIHVPKRLDKINSLLGIVTSRKSSSSALSYTFSLLQLVIHGSNVKFIVF
jgi:hypothetical protein